MKHRNTQSNEPEQLKYFQFTCSFPDDDSTVDNKLTDDEEESGAKTGVILQVDLAIPTTGIFGDSGFHKTRPSVRPVLPFDRWILRESKPTIKATSTPAPMETTDLTPAEIGEFIEKH